MSTPDIKQKPDPKMRYEITVITHGAPGPFDSVAGNMQFHIANAADCVPKDPVSGAHVVTDYDPPIVLTRRNDHEYTGVIYLDLLKDENYYGLGTCRWEFVSFHVGLNVHNVSFSPDISRDEIISRKSTTRYFSKESYLDTTFKNPVDLGMPTNSERYAVEHPEQFFNVEITAQEGFR